MIINSKKFLVWVNSMKKIMGRAVHAVITVAAIITTVFLSRTVVYASGTNVYTGDYVPATLNGTTYSSADAKDFVNVNRYTLNSGGTNTKGDYYDLLSSTQKVIYTAIGEASVSPYTTKYEWKSDVSYAGELTGLSTVSSSDYTVAQQAFAYDHPGQLESQLCYAYLPSVSGTLYLAYYNQDGYDFDSMESELRAARISFLSGIDLTGSSADVEMKVHDALIKSVTYNKTCATANNSHHVGHTAYGALVDKTCVCDGYSVAFMYLLEACDIEAKVVTGYAGTVSLGGHAWNIVNIDDSWYEVDTTWDDQSVATKMYYPALTHMFYNLTTAQITLMIETKGTTYIDPTGTVDDYVITSSKTYKHNRAFVGALMNEYIGTDATYSYSNLTNDAYIVTVQDVESVSLDINEYVFSLAGETLQLTATVLPEDANDKSVKWTSSNKSIATVDSNGLVTCVSDGTATITVATNSGDYKDTCTVSYTAPAEQADLDADADSNSEASSSGSSSSSGTETAAATDNSTTTVETVQSTDTTASAIVGTEFKYGKGKYVVTGDKEVAFKKPVKKTYSSFTIPQTITVDGCEYTVTSISAKAFYKCTKLKTITIPKYVMTIGNNAFNKCTSLKKITLPKYLKSIGKKAFYGCKNLKKVTIKSTQLTSIGKKAFRGVHKDIVYKLPAAKKKKYKSLIKKSS